MTVAELVETLKTLPQDVPVYVACEGAEPAIVAYHEPKPHRDEPNGAVVIRG